MSSSYCCLVHDADILAFFCCCCCCCCRSCLRLYSFQCDDFYGIVWIILTGRQIGLLRLQYEACKERSVIWKQPTWGKSVHQHSIMNAPSVLVQNVVNRHSVLPIPPCKRARSFVESRNTIAMLRIIAELIQRIIQVELLHARTFLAFIHVSCNNHRQFPIIAKLGNFFVHKNAALFARLRTSVIPMCVATEKFDVGYFVEKLQPNTVSLACCIPSHWARNLWRRAKPKYSLVFLFEALFQKENRLIFVSVIFISASTKITVFCTSVQNLTSSLNQMNTRGRNLAKSWVCSRCGSWKATISGA